MYGWLWTNKCCMCVRSTHAEVGRSGRVGRRKADFGPVASPPRGGFGGFEGVISGRWRAQKSRGASRGEGDRSVLGAQTGVAGGTSGPNWGHNRRAVGGFGGFQGFCETSPGVQKNLPGIRFGRFYDGNTTGKRWSTGCCPMCPLRGALLGSLWPHRGGTCCRPGGI